MQVRRETGSLDHHQDMQGGAESKVTNGRQRVVIEGVKPEIDAGRFPIKRTVGEEIVVEADIFADGHDLLSVSLRYRHTADRNWTEVPMQSLTNDRWRAAFVV